MPPAYAPGPQRATAGHVLRDDHRWHGPGDPDPEADPERREEQQTDRRHDRADQAEAGDQAQAQRQGQPRPQPGGDPRSDGREQAHAQHRDRRDQAAHAGRQVQVRPDRRQERTDRQQLRAQRDGRQEEPDDHGQRERSATPRDAVGGLAGGGAVRSPGSGRSDTRARYPKRGRPRRAGVEHRRPGARPLGRPGQATASPASTGSPISIGLLIGSWLHSNQPPS